MDIGNRLKNTRVFLRLTQEQFSAGIVTESFYSRVENNKSKISMNDLLNILNYHHVSLYDFFVSDDIKYIKNNIMQVFIDGNINKLQEYQILLRSMRKKYKLEFKVMFAILNDSVDKLSEETKQKIRRQLLKIGKLNEEFLFNINLLAPIIDFQSLKFLISYVLYSSKLEEMDNFTLQLLCHSLLSFLKRCYEEDDKQEAKKVIKFFAKIPETSYVFLEKLLADSYECLFNGDKDNLDNTIRVLRLCGYEKYAADLEKIQM